MGRRHGHRSDQVGIEVAQHKPCVAVHLLATALSSVAHIGLLNRDALLLCDTLAQPSRAPKNSQALAAETLA